MAKELPYFKFEPNQWDNGKIQMLSHLEKGVFIDLCSMYWSRLGDVPYKLAVQKICGGNAVALDSLCEEKIFEVIEGKIFIKYLSEQLEDFQEVSNKNSKNAKDGWEKRRKQGELSDRIATALRNESDPNAIREDKSREDKSRVKEIRKENIKNINTTSKISFSQDVISCTKNCLNYFDEHLQPKTPREKNAWCKTVQTLNERDNIPFDFIQVLTKEIRKDDFWSKNFLSLNKLAKKNKDGVPYIVVFAEHIKAKNKAAGVVNMASLEKQIFDLVGNKTYKEFYGNK